MLTCVVIVSGRLFCCVSLELSSPWYPVACSQNVDSRTHNVRLRQPKNISVWSVDPPTMNVRLAPGMETTVQVSLSLRQRLSNPRRISMR